MASIAYSLYNNPEQRENCYKCPSGGAAPEINVSGKVMQLDCRMYTEMGNDLETRLSAMQADIFAANLIDIVEIGVDTARLSFGKKLKFKTQSRGAGGLSKYECAVDYQIPDIIRHDKLGYTEMLYVHYKGCPKKFISTELQGMVFENEAFSDANDPNNALGDWIMGGARETVSEAVQFTDIIGQYGGANERANAYDGILAQAYWAYTGMAFFHSVEFTVDEAILTDGMYLHAKYSGCQIDLQFDSSQPSDPSEERYATYAELYMRLVDWLNHEVLTVSGRRYVDATYVSNKVIVTSKWTEETVNLQMFVDAEATVKSWAACDTFPGVTYETLQGAMPIDERPFLVKWRRYNLNNVLSALPEDIFNATIDMDKTLLMPGQSLALYIDDKLWQTYRQALKTRPTDATAYNIEDDYTVYTIDALSEYGGTGIWFITVESTTEMLRNIAHLVDVERADMDAISLTVTPNCREMEMLYEVLHGVMVKDFRLFASNLLCSPFADQLKEPYEKTLPMIPCFNRAVRSTWIDPISCETGCNIMASFVIADEYKNGALYELDGVIYVLEDGGVLPNGAFPVYEIQFKDTTTGIPITQTADYEYVITTDGGAEIVLTGKDPIFQYSGSATGITFNVTQTVSIPGLANCAASTYNASDDFPDDYPFECRGACADLELDFKGRIDRNLLDSYSIANPIFQVGDTDVVNENETIALVANNGADAATELQAYLTANSLPGTAVWDGGSNTLTIAGTGISWDTFDGDPFVQAEEFDITVLDDTVYDTGDGIASAEVRVYVTGGAVEQTFADLPENELITDNSATGWDVRATITTKFGCTFELEVINVTIGAGESFANFDLPKA